VAFTIVSLLSFSNFITMIYLTFEQLFFLTNFRQQIKER
jgi:hypothetical protein